MVRMVIMDMSMIVRVSVHRSRSGWKFLAAAIARHKKRGPED
jgi:hypothetical protein